jgi:hypothetical protein
VAEVVASASVAAVVLQEVSMLPATVSSRGRHGRRFRRRFLHFCFDRPGFDSRSRWGAEPEPVAALLFGFFFRNYGSRRWCFNRLWRRDFR